MAKQKATHFGECQVCGRRQKLPGGLLALHGYTTRWGFFSGTCPGSTEFPFEQKKEVAEGALAGALEEIERKEKQAAAHLAGEGDVRFHEWDRLSGSYRWAVIPKDDTFDDHLVRAARIAQGFTLWKGYAKNDAGEYILDAEGNRVFDPRKIEAELRKEYASHLGAVSLKLLGYVDWQRRRLATWEPKELEPIPSK